MRVVKLSLMFLSAEIFSEMADIERALSLTSEDHYTDKVAQTFLSCRRGACRIATREGSLPILRFQAIAGVRITNFDSCGAIGLGESVRF